MADFDMLDAAKLLATTMLELSLEPDGYHAWNQGGAEYPRYRELKQYLGEHFTTAAEHDETTLRNWQETLHEVGDLRQVICSNIMSYQEHLVREEQARAAAEAQELSRHNDALEDVKQAIRDSAEVVRITGLLTKINDLAGVLRSGNPWDLIQVIPGPPDLDDVIEAGLEVLGRYQVALELVSHGYASLDELRRAIASSMEDIGEMWRRIDDAKDRYFAAQVLYAVPAMGG